jgi:hypothetical protein
MLNNMRHGDDIWFSENGGGMVKRFAYDKVINNNVYPDAPGFLPKPVIEKAAGEVARHAAALKELRSLKDREGVK